MSAHATRWALGADKIGFGNIEGWARIGAKLQEMLHSRQHRDYQDSRSGEAAAL